MVKHQSLAVQLCNCCANVTEASRHGEHILKCCAARLRRQEFSFGGVAQGVSGQKSPSRIQGQSSSRGSGSPPKGFQTLFPGFDCRNDQNSKLWDWHPDSWPVCFTVGLSNILRGLSLPEPMSGWCHHWCSWAKYGCNIETPDNNQIFMFLQAITVLHCVWHTARHNEMVCTANKCSVFHL